MSMKKYKMPEHRSWTAMINRCTNPKHEKYKYYGGRGIKVCKRWLIFDNFLNDLGLKPSAKHSLDRINNNKNYTPANCRWATIKQQQNNRRSNRFITYKNKTKTLAQWSEKTGISISTLHIRLKNGVPLKKVFCKNSIQKGVFKKLKVYHGH